MLLVVEMRRGVREARVSFLLLFVSLHCFFLVRLFRGKSETADGMAELAHVEPRRSSNEGSPKLRSKSKNAIQLSC